MNSLLRGREGVIVFRYRTHLHLTQKEFAKRYDLSEGVVRDWEQGNRISSLAARLFMEIIRRDDQQFIYDQLNQLKEEHEKADT